MPRRRLVLSGDTHSHRVDDGAENEPEAIQTEQEECARQQQGIHEVE